MTSLSNPDTRPLPPGWHQHFDTERQSWYYVQINVLPPKVSYAHPASLTPALSCRPTPVPVPQSEPAQSATEASSAKTSFIRSYTPVSAKLSAAQQLYASAINKRNIRSNSPGLESSTAQTSSLSPPAVPLAQNYASMSPPMRLFPDLSKNTQPAGPTELYNRTVVSQQGGTTPGSLRNVDSGQPQSFNDSPSRRSQSLQRLQLPPPPRNGPHQPQRALTETSQLDLLNKNNTNVVISRPTRMGETPTIAMVARPPSADQRSHPDTLISPPLYASTGPISNIRYDTSGASLPPLLTRPNSPPTYYESGENRQITSYVLPNYSSTPNQSQQQRSSGLTVPNQPPGTQQRAVESPQIYSGSQYAHQPSQQVPSQQLNQSRASMAVPQQSTFAGSQIPPPQLNQKQTPRAFQQQGHSEFNKTSQDLNQSQAPTIFQQMPPQQLNQSQVPQQMTPLQSVQNLAPLVDPRTSSGSAHFRGHSHFPPNQPAATVTQYQTYGQPPPIYQAYQAQLQSPPPPPPPQQYNISGPISNPYESQHANMHRQPVHAAPSQAQRQPQPHSSLEQLEEQLVVGFVRGVTGTHGAGHHGGTAHHGAAQPAQHQESQNSGTDTGIISNHVVDPSLGESQVTVVDTRSDSDDQFTYTDTQIDVYDTWPDGLGDSFTSLSVDDSTFTSFNC